MRFKAKKVMKWKDYLILKEKVASSKSFRLINLMTAPAEITANRIEVILELEWEEMVK